MRLATTFLVKLFQEVAFHLENFQGHDAVNTVET
jgi:hypothetical protein